MQKLLLTILVLISTLFHSHAQKTDSTYSKLKDTAALDEFVIVNKVAIKVTKDTVSYTVDSFNRNAQATTEDVLKRLPGVDVASDGTITVQGKTVAKLYINGKEYTAQDLRTITQNMPAEVLEKIQFADYQDEDAQFTGIKPNTDKKIINLQFKKKYKGTILSRLSAGYGTNNRYQAGLFTNYITDTVRITAIGYAGNTGVNDANSQGNDNTRAGSRPQNGINNRQGGNLNFSYEPGKRFRLNGTYDVSNSMNDLTQTIFRTTYLPGDSQQLRTQGTTQTANTMQHHLSLRSYYEVNDRNILQLDGGIGYQAATTHSNTTDAIAYQYVDNTSFRRTADNHTDNKRPSYNLSAIYRRRFQKPKRTLMLTGNVNYGNGRGSGTNNNINEYFAPGYDNSTSFISSDDINNLSATGSLRYTEPLGKRHLLSFSYSYNYTKGNSTKEVFADTGNVLVKDTIQSRSYNNRNIDQPLSLTYQYSAEKLTANATFMAKPYYRYSGQNTSVGTVEQSGINYAPGLSLRYDLGTGKSLSFGYSGSITAPDISQLQPIPDYTDSLNIRIGNPSLRPEVTHNASLSLNYTDPKKQRVAWVQVNGGKTDNKIISKTDITATKRISSYANENGTYHMGASANYAAPFLVKKMKLITGINGNYNNNISYTNGTLLNVGSYYIQPSVRLLYISDAYEGDLNASYRTSIVDNPAAISNTLQTYSVVQTGAIALPFKTKLVYYVSYMYNIGLASDLQRDFLLVNASFDKNFDHPRGFSIRLQAFDIFNNYPTVTRTVGDNYFEDRGVNRVGSYYMLSLVYKFTKGKTR
ncbi:MAG: TonB-dependent receptor [Bacteroidetes bacterium]|nr:TonB-dependent receptor [Bacteroidota bacterium]